MNEQTPTQTPEELMAIAYQMMFRINTAECARIEGNPGELEIRLEGTPQRFEDFLKNSTRIVVIDQYSTKEINDQAIRNSGMPPEVAQHYSRLYLEAHRFWAVIEHKKQPIGVADRVIVYNGFPRLVTAEEYLADPNKTYEKASDLMMQKSAHEIFSVQPERTERIRVLLHRDFLAQNPIYPLEKVK